MGYVRKGHSRMMGRNKSRAWTHDKWPGGMVPGPAVGYVREGHPQTRGRRKVLDSREVAAVDGAEASGGAELGPVGGPGEPVQVLAQEGVDGRPAVHDGVGKDDSRMAYAVAGLYGALHVLQDLQCMCNGLQQMNETKY